MRVEGPADQSLRVDVDFRYRVVVSAPGEDPMTALDLRRGHCGGIVAGIDNATLLLPGEKAFMHREMPVVGVVDIRSDPLTSTAEFRTHGYGVDVEPDGHADVLVWLDGYQEALPQFGDNSGSLSLASETPFRVRRLQVDGLCSTQPQEFEQASYETLRGQFEGTLATRLPPGSKHIGFIALGADVRTDIRLDGPDGPVGSWDAPIQGWFHLDAEVASLTADLESTRTPSTIVFWITMDASTDLTVQLRRMLQLDQR